MTWSVGRLSFAGEPETYEHKTGVIAVGARVQVDGGPTGRKGIAEHLRRQVVAMADISSEAVVPVSIEDGFNGFASVLTATSEAWHMDTGEVDVAFTLAPVLGAEMPVVETIRDGALRQNTHGVDDDEERARPLHSIPAAAEGWGIAGTTTAETRDVEGGQVRVRTSIDGLGAVPVYRGLVTWMCEPGQWYVGACGVAELVEGKELPVVAPASLIRPWMVSNGLVRWWVEPDSYEIKVQWFGPDGWSQRSTPLDPLTFSLGRIADTITTWRAANVARLTPESVTVHLTGTWATGVEPFVEHAWLTIRRGSPWIDVRLGTDQSTLFGTVVRRDVVNEGTHIISEPIDGFPWRFVIASATGAAQTGSDEGKILGGASFGLAAVHDDWTGWLADDEIWREWYAAQAERTSVGARL